MSDPSAKPAAPTRRHAPSLWPWFAAHRREFLIGSAFLVATNLGAAALPWLLKRAIDSFERGHASDAPAVAAVMVAVALVQAACRTASRVFIFNGGRAIEFDLRNRLYAHLLKLSPRYFGDAPVGDLISRTTSDIGNVRVLFGPGILNLVNTAIVYVAVAAPMIHLDPRLALLALLPFPILFAVSQTLGRRMFQQTADAQAGLAALSTVAHETITGQSVVRAYALEDARDRAFTAASRSALDASLALARTRAAMTPLLGAVSAIGTLVVLVAGGAAAISGRLSIGGLAAFISYLGMLLWPTMALGWVLAMYHRGLASLERLVEVTSAVPEVVGPAPGPSAAGAAEVSGAISLRGLRFTWGDREVLRGIDLEVRPGEQVAVVGPSGAGKSTLVQLLPRLCDPSAGEVRLGGRPLRDFPLHTLRRSVAFVPQEPFLFSMTIRENVEFGTGRLPEVAVREALRLACIEAEVDAFPAGLDTRVGERGVTLSGGQRQRLTIARAAVLRPRIWVFDDCLSSVDAATERRILTNLREMTRGTTTLFVTHRVLGLAAVDRIVVLQDGRVTETGTHAELLARGGWYARLYRRQLLEPGEGETRESA